MCVCVCVCVCAHLTTITDDDSGVKSPLRERDLASELRIVKMHNRQMFEYYCTLKQLATLVRENLQDNVYI